MSADPTTITAALGLEPTYSAQEASEMLGRSYSWLDQRLRAGLFIRTDGATVQPSQTPSGYRRFTLAVLQDIAVCATNQGWFTMGELKLALRELASPPTARQASTRFPDDAPGLRP